MHMFQIGKLTIAANENGASIINGTLSEGVPGYDENVNGIESFLVALALEGVKIDSPEFQAALEGSLIGLANGY